MSQGCTCAAGFNNDESEATVLTPVLSDGEAKRMTLCDAHS